MKEQFEKLYQAHKNDIRATGINDRKIGRAYMTYAEERDGFVITEGKSPADAWAEVVKFHPYMQE